MDHPSNTKRGCVCLYQKCLLPLKVTDVSYIQECINFDVKIGDETCEFVSLSRSPKKWIWDNLEHMVNKSPFLIIVSGDFNARLQG